MKEIDNNESMLSVKSEENGNKDKDERTYKIIGAAMEVHKELVCGFLEPVYQEALDTEFKDQAISYKAQPVIEISYQENILEKKYQSDFVCFNDVIVEIKALSKLTGTEESQINPLIVADKKTIKSLEERITRSCKSKDVPKQQIA
jgi:GxxExxY protein